LITVTAWVEGGAAPFTNPTFGFHAAIYPSSVAKMKAAGPPPNTKSVVLPLAMITAKAANHQKRF
jgi:hypothetical protein